MNDTTNTSVLVTGVGGAAGIAVLRALAGTGRRLLGADCDPLAAGLHLLPARHRVLLPRGDDPGYLDAVLDVAAARGVDVVVPTVDEELLPLATARGALERVGTRLLAAGVETLRTCLDKHALVRAVETAVRCPRTELLDALLDPSSWTYPAVVKPRSGRGGRGVRIVTAAADLAGLPRDGSLIVQELLPGAEYSVDVLADRCGRVVAAVPRERLRVDSGVAVVARTVSDAGLEQAARAVARAVGLRGPANVQLRRDAHGRPALLEVNPRFPGTLASTVAAGVNLPALALDDLAGKTLPAHCGRFAEVGMVRLLADLVVPVSDLLPRAGERETAVVAVG